MPGLEDERNTGYAQGTSKASIVQLQELMSIQQRPGACFTSHYGFHGVGSLRLKIAIALWIHGFHWYGKWYLMSSVELPGNGFK